MPALPTVASDNNIWGTELNNWLLSQHNADGTHGPPIGTAGGDLSSTYPNPTVSRINGVAVTGTPSSGQVPTATGAATATWQAPASVSPNGTAGGDLSSTYPNPTVARINGITVTGTPSVGQVPTATGTTAATWQTPTGGGMANPMTTAGDLIDGGTAGVPTRVPVGSNGQYLGVVSGVPAWTAAPGASAIAFSVAAFNATAAEKAVAQYTVTANTGSGAGSAPAQIQAAIDAAATQGGATVQLSSGTFNIPTRVNMKSQVTLRGVGKNATILVPTGTGIGVPDSFTQWTISDLWLNGGVEGVRIPGSNGEWTIRNVQFGPCSGRGLVTNAVERFILDNCSFVHCAGGGWRAGQRWLAGDADPDPANPATFTGFANGRTERFLVTSCRIDSCGVTANLPGFLLQDSGPNFANGTHDPKFDDARFGGQMLGPYNQGVGTFQSNNFILNYGSGVEAHVAWGLNFIANNGEVQGKGASGFAGIYIADGYKCNLIDNQFDSYGSPRQDYGIRCGAYWSVIINNDCDGAIAGYLLTENSIDMRQNIGSVATSGSALNTKGSMSTINGPSVSWSGGTPPYSNVISPQGTPLILGLVDSNGDGSGTWSTFQLKQNQNAGANTILMQVGTDGKIHLKSSLTQTIAGIFAFDL